MRASLGIGTAILSNSGCDGEVRFPSVLRYGEIFPSLIRLGKVVSILQNVRKTHLSIKPTLAKDISPNAKRRSIVYET